MFVVCLLNSVVHGHSSPWTLSVAGTSPIDCAILSVANFIVSMSFED